MIKLFYKLLGGVKMKITPETKTLDFVDKLNIDDGSSIQIGLNTPLFLNKSINKDKSAWTIDDIKERTEILIHKLLEIF